MHQIATRNLTEQPTLVVRGRACAEHLDEFLRDAFAKVEDHAREVHVEIAGPPFARCRPLDDELLEFDVEAGFPVSRAAPGEGDVEASALPGGSAAATWHTGPYETLCSAHDALTAWVEGRGGRTIEPAWEVYYSTPDVGSDPSQWETELIQPFV